jgi:hypothetical protein
MSFLRLNSIHRGGNQGKVLLSRGRACSASIQQIINIITTITYPRQNP